MRKDIDLKNEEEKKEKRTNFKTAVLFIVIDHINAEDNMTFFSIQRMSSLFAATFVRASSRDESCRETENSACATFMLKKDDHPGKDEGDSHEQ